MSSIHVRPSLIAAILVLLIPGAGVIAQDLPAFYATASRGTVLRELPEKDGPRLARLEKGDWVHCRTDPTTLQPEQDAGAAFYRIRTQDGRSGWALRSMVRLHPGPPPEPLPTQQMTDAESVAKAFHLSMGKPKAFTVLENEGYVVGYDPRLKIPTWVQYKLTKQDFATDRDRSNSFDSDGRLHPEGRALLTDYEVAAGWDVWIELGLEPARTSTDHTPAYARGHLVPARSQTRTEELEEQTYLLSNMAPQVHSGFNSGTWSSLEKHVRQWCEVRGPLTIVTGPIFHSSLRQITPARQEDDRLAAVEPADAFDPDRPAVLAQPPTERQVIYNVVGPTEVAIPTGFFKVIVDANGPDDPEVLAFIVPHYRKTTAQGRQLGDLLTSVDEIETLTGLDLLSGLGDEVEARVEKSVATALW